MAHLVWLVDLQAAPYSSNPMEMCAVSRCRRSMMSGMIPLSADLHRNLHARRRHFDSVAFVGVFDPYVDSL